MASFWGFLKPIDLTEIWDFGFGLFLCFPFFPLGFSHVFPMFFVFLVVFSFVPFFVLSFSANRSDRNLGFWFWFVFLRFPFFPLGFSHVFPMFFVFFGCFFLLYLFLCLHFRPIDLTEIWDFGFGLFLLEGWKPRKRLHHISTCSLVSMYRVIRGMDCLGTYFNTCPNLM